MPDYLVAWHQAFTRRGIAPTVFEWDMAAEVPRLLKWPGFSVVLSGPAAAAQLSILHESGRGASLRAWHFRTANGTMTTVPISPEDVFELTDWLDVLAAQTTASTTTSIRLR